MIRQFFVITDGGLLAFFRSFVAEKTDPELVSGFLTAMASFAEEIGGKNIQKLEFMQFNFIFNGWKNKLKFVLSIERDDLIEECEERLELVKDEFIKRFAKEFEKNWNGDVKIFKDFDKIADKLLVIPPKFLLIGNRGAGKTSILNLFPGDIVITLDEDLNDVVKKSIKVNGLDLIKRITLQELDFDEVLDNSIMFKPLLLAADFILIVTESSGSKLGKTLKNYKHLKKIIKREDFIYIIANKQDIIDIAFEPEKISKNFGLKTYGLSSTEPKAKQKIFEIFADILRRKFRE